MNSLFVEASAKTSVGVTDAFREVVVNIMNSPDLWRTPDSNKPSGSGAGANGPGRTSNVALNETMPGTITLDEHDAQDAYGGGCAC